MWRESGVLAMPITVIGVLAVPLTVVGIDPCGPATTWLRGLDAAVSTADRASLSVLIW